MARPQALCQFSDAIGVFEPEEVFAETDVRGFLFELGAEFEQQRDDGIHFLLFVVDCSAVYWESFECDGSFGDEAQAVNILAHRFRKVPEGWHVGVLLLCSLVLQSLEVLELSKECAVAGTGAIAKRSSLLCM